MFDIVFDVSIEEKKLIKVKNDIFSQEKLINYLKIMIDKEYEKNDFNNYNLIELEDYKIKLTELTEEWIKNYKKQEENIVKEIVNNKVKENNIDRKIDSWIGIRKGYEIKEKITGKGKGDRGYHTSVRGGHLFNSLILPEIPKYVCNFENNICTKFFRQYSNESIELTNDKKDENFSMFFNQKMREKFFKWSFSF